MPARGRGGKLRHESASGSPSCKAGGCVSKAIYVLYLGDEVIDMGTKDELAKRRNVKPDTIYFYSTQAYRKRIKGQDNRLLAVKVD